MKHSKPLDSLIISVRGHRVILDTDLARLYGVATFRLNEAFKRNRNRFPEDFAFQLTADEFAKSKSKGVEPEGDAPNSSQIAMSSKVKKRHRGGAYLPWAFTEHGALMVANVVRSDKAIEMSVFVVRAFVQMREQIAANSEVLKRLAEVDKKLLEHDETLLTIWTQLEPLLAPPPEPKRRQIGFVTDP
jgi:hypothetical protein